MGTDGIGPGGTVGRGLLRDDPLAPFGWRLDHAKVLSAFEEEWAWPGESVVLVEASDLSRAAAYGGRSTPMQAPALRDAALLRADALPGALLGRPAPVTHAVMVPSPGAGRPT